MPLQKYDSIVDFNDWPSAPIFTAGTVLLVRRKRRRIAKLARFMASSPLSPNFWSMSAIAKGERPSQRLKGTSFHMAIVCSCASAHYLPARSCDALAPIYQLRASTATIAHTPKGIRQLRSFFSSFLSSWRLFKAAIGHFEYCLVEMWPCPCSLGPQEHPWRPTTLPLTNPLSTHYLNRSPGSLGFDSSDLSRGPDYLLTFKTR